MHKSKKTGEIYLGRSKTMKSKTKIAGVKLADWPIDELLYLPWHMTSHLTDTEKQWILNEAKRRGIPLPK
jgi:hypothetical protein